MLEYLVSLPYRLHRRGVSALRVRFAPQIAFIRARLSPRGYFGSRLTGGALVLIGASWLFGGISQDVVAGDPLTVVDVLVAQWFNAHSTPLLTQWMLAITRLHDFVPLAAVLLIAFFLAWRRDWCWLIALGATVPFGMLLNIAMKYAFHRVRPSFDHPLLVLASYSVPSGHAVGATLFYGILAAILVSKVKAWHWPRPHPRRTGSSFIYGQWVPRSPMER